MFFFPIPTPVFDQITLPSDITIDDSATNSYSVSVPGSGEAHANRRLFALIHWVEGTTERTISSVTIGGVSATVRQEGHNGGSTGLGCAIASAIVPTGSVTNATVAITFSGTASGVGISLIRAVGLTQTSVFDFGTAESTSTAVTISDTVNIPPSGLLIAVYTGSTNTEAVAVTWTGATELYDKAGPAHATASPDQVRCSAAALYYLNGEVGRTVQAAITSTPDAGNDMVIESWT